MTGWTRAIAGAACLFGWVGCTGPTELVVLTESDLAVPTELDELVFEIEAPDGRRSTRTAPLTGQDAVELPVTVVLLHGEGPLGPVEVSAIGRADGVEVVRRGAIAWFVAGRSVLVPLDLTRSCLDVTCPLGTTCVAGACHTLPYDGSDGGAGPVDAGGHVGPSPVEDAGDSGPVCAAGCACVQSCEGGCQCEDGCHCDLYCGAGADCTSGKCKDVGTTCTLSARGAEDLSHTCESDARCTIDARGVSNVDRITCKSDADCEVDCTGASNCEVECQDDATCLLDCSETSNCFISDCGELDDGEELQQCADGILVCRRACP